MAPHKTSNVRLDPIYFSTWRPSFYSQKLFMCNSPELRETLGLSLRILPQFVIPSPQTRSISVLITFSAAKYSTAISRATRLLPS